MMRKNFSLLILAALFSLRAAAAVDDSGMEAIRKSAEEVVPGDKSEYQLKMRVSGSIPAPVNSGGSGSTSTVSTVQTLTAPANAVGFILMNLTTSTTDMRWAVGREASPTVGQELQPGRDTGFIPMGADISVCAESSTVTYDIQWVTQQ